MADLAEPLAGPSADPVVRTRSAPVPRPRLAVRSWSVARRFVLVLMALYVAKQVLYVVAFPPFSGHDEVAHYAYVQTVATEGRVPVLPDLERWREDIRATRDASIDQIPDEFYPYCRYVLYWHCEPNNPKWSNSPPRIMNYLGDFYSTGYQYTANHPPLYYMLMTPLYWASDGSSAVARQYLLRLAAIPFGLVTVFLAYRLVRALFPGDTFLAVTVPTVVAFQPQISYEAAMVNNDIVAIALYSWLLYLLIVGVRDRFPRRTCVLLGFALGLALLTKGTSLTAAPIIALAIVLAVGWRNVRGWVVRGALVVAPAAILAAPWYAFLYRTYGNFDGLDQIEALQAYWNRPAGTFFGMLFSRDFIVDRFHETWGQFGWRMIPLDPAFLWAIALPLIVAVGGLIQYALTAGRGGARSGDDPVERPARWQWYGLLVLAVTCVVAYLAIVQFGTRFALTQARYYFPAVNAAALLLMLGLRTLIPRSYHTVGQAAVFAAMVLLNVLIFTQYVVPYYLSV